MLILAAITLTLTSHSCSSTMPSSVKEYDCTKPSRNSNNVGYISGTPGILISSSYCKDYTFIKEKVERAIHMFVEEYSSQFGVPKEEIWSHLSGLHIEASAYSRTVPGAYDEKGNFIKKPWVSGLALSKKHIWVEVKTNNIYASSLIHELVHAVIWNTQGVHGDPDHEGSQFSGWTPEHSLLIKRVNEALLESGI